MLMWGLGMIVGLVGIPALLGFLAGARLDQSAAHTVPYRLVFVTIGIGLGGLAAWRVIRRSTR
jgi:hypothetical protein